MTGKDQAVASLRLLSTGAQANQKQNLSYQLSNSHSVLLGRDLRCHVALDPMIYRNVSRQHARVSPMVGADPHGRCLWQVCDLNSSNGTFLNGVRLQECRVLQAGDRISLGHNGPEFIFDYSAALEPVIPSDSATPPTFSANIPPQKTAPKQAVPKVNDLPVDSVSITQLFPILSTGRELGRKAYLLPAATTILFVVLLFIAIGNPFAFNLLLACYLAIAAYYCVYQLCGKRKAWWAIVLMAGTTALLLVSPFLDLYVFVFHRLLPGDVSNTNAQTNIFVLLIKMFFGAGLMEELLKATPVLAMYWISSRLHPSVRQRAGLVEPLDGILLGAASAVGFSLLETLGIYVPATYHSALAAGQDAANLAGLQLLIPRVLGLVAGHMAYSGYFGYFIGLSALRRRQKKLILGVGFLTSALLHAFWNAAGMLNPIFLAVIGGVSYAFLGAAILKARVLSPTRSQNFATRFYE